MRRPLTRWPAHLAPHLLFLIPELLATVRARLTGSTFASKFAPQPPTDATTFTPFACAAATSAGSTYDATLFNPPCDEGDEGNTNACATCVIFDHGIVDTGIVDFVHVA